MLWKSLLILPVFISISFIEGPLDLNVHCFIKYLTLMSISYYHLFKVSTHPSMSSVYLFQPDFLLLQHPAALVQQNSLILWWPSSSRQLVNGSVKYVWYRTKRMSLPVWPVQHLSHSSSSNLQLETGHVIRVWSVIKSPPSVVLPVVVPDLDRLERKQVSHLTYKPVTNGINIWHSLPTYKPEANGINIWRSLFRYKHIKNGIDIWWSHVHLFLDDNEFDH